MCTKPLSLIPKSTKHPKAVILFTIPGKIMPVFKSEIERTFGSNSKIFAAFLGSNPGFSNSFKMSFKVKIPISAVI